MAAAALRPCACYTPFHHMHGPWIRAEVPIAKRSGSKETAREIACGKCARTGLRENRFRRHTHCDYTLCGRIEGPSITRRELLATHHISSGHCAIPQHPLERLSCVVFWHMSALRPTVRRSALLYTFVSERVRKSMQGAITGHKLHSFTIRAFLK